MSMQAQLNLTLSACYRGYEPQKQTTESVAEKQQGKFSLSNSQSVWNSSARSTGTKSIFNGVTLYLFMSCKLTGDHPLFSLHMLPVNTTCSVAHGWLWFRW